MICHHYKCIFVHIPKNAGQSIEHVFLKLLGLKWETRAPLLLRPNDRPELGPPRLAHLKAMDYVRLKYIPKQMFEDYFKFAFVRNPWDRMVSFYRYLGFSKKLDFKTFLTANFKNEIFYRHHWFVGQQYTFVYSQERKLIVDYLGRFENLQKDFDHVCKKIGIPVTVLPHVNKSKRNSPGIVEKPNQDSDGSECGNRFIIKPGYRKYYDQECIDCVAELYREDIEIFGYDFD